MEIVGDRCQSGSTIITGQLPVSTWHDAIGEPTFADAILDRLGHNRTASNSKASPYGRQTPGKMTPAPQNDTESLRP